MAEKREGRKLPRGEKDVDVGYDDLFTKLPKGVYIFEVGRIDFTDNNAGDEQMRIPLRVCAGKFSGSTVNDYFGMGDNLRWKRMMFFQAAGIESGSMSWKELIKKLYKTKVHCEVGSREWEGKDYMDFERYWPWVEGESLEPTIPEPDENGGGDSIGDAVDKAGKDEGWDNDDDWG